jgi:NhaP-type Na+/H+ or K+/H+ antiporter
MSSDIGYAFLILSMTIGMGFLAIILAKRYKISQVIFLMLFGLLLGPGLHIIDVGSGSVIRQIYPFMSALALIILLFDGGVSLNIFNVFNTITESVIFTATVFIFSMLSSLILVPIYHINIFDALFIGALLSGVSSAIVIALLDKIKVDEDTKSLLTLESVLNDSLVIIAVFLLIQLHENAALVSPEGVIKSLGVSIIISTVIGSALAYGWNKVLKFLKEYELDYMLTLAVLFLTYFFAEFFGGNGGLAVFVFGLVFGNLHNLPSQLLSFSILQRERIKGFQEEVTFFTRTFFFTYIGLLFPLSNISLQVVMMSLLLTGVFIIVRYISTKLILNNKNVPSELVVGMMPRGLAAAVGVGLLIQHNIHIPNIEQIVFSVIFLTNLIATFFVFEYGRKNEAINIDDEKEFVKELAAEESKEEDGKLEKEDSKEQMKEDDEKEHIQRIE